MNKEKVNKIYCPTIFGYGIVAIFLTQLNMLIHFSLPMGGACFCRCVELFICRCAYGRCLFRYDI